VKPIVDPYEIPRLPVSWANNPIYAALDPRDGKQKVVVAPMDGPYLLCLSAEQGDLLWKFPCYDVEFAEEDVHRRAAEPPTLYRYVLGVRDGVVYLSGQRAAAISLTGMKRVWAPVNLQGPSSGRGVVAADGVYIPQRGGVKKLGLKRPDEGMETLRWPSDVEPGNLVLVEQALVAAGREAVTVCYDPAKVRAFYTSEIQKNPSSAYLRYRLALCLLQAGETQAAEDALKAALDLARRRSDEDSAAIVEACRRTLFRNRMSSASVFLRRTDGGRRAVEEIEKARAYAATDGDWLELLFELSRAHRQANQPAEAVAALQEIVEKHGLVLLDAQEPARDRAAREIAALLARHGREAYAPFEDQARAALEIARRDADPAAFEDVLRRFPNSLAAEDAACGVGRARFAAGDWTGACEAFGRFLREYPASRLVPQATAELATAYEKRGMLAMAGAQLRRLKKQHADAEIQMEGGRVSAGKWAEAKLAGAAFAKSAGAGAAPALTWPAKKTWTWTGQRAWDTAVVVPRGDGGWKAPVALVMTGGRVAVLHIGSGKELWQAAGPAQARFAAFSSGLLVVAGATDIQAYRETGETAWRASHGGNVLGCAVEAEGSVYLAARDFRNRCFVAAYDASTGQQSWEAELASGHFVQDLWVMEDRVAWRSRDETSLILADRESGAVRSRFALLASRLLPAGPDRFLAVPAPDRLSLIDAGTGKPVWSQPCPGLWLDQPPEVRGGTAVALAMEDESFRLRGFDLETGKLLYSTDLGGIWPKQFLADERTVWVVLKSVDPPHAFTAYAYELRSGKRLWETPLPGVTSLYPGLLSRDEVILNAPMFRKDETGAGRWVPTLIALDKETGTESGRIEGRPASTPTYKVELAPGRVLMTQDETVEGWGR
jgi:outer membrane protein assembly factor BamB